MSTEALRVAVAQYAAGVSQAESLGRLRELLPPRLGADVLVLPEYSDLDVSRLGRHGLEKRAASIGDNVFVEGLAEIASRGVLVVAGVVERSGGCLYSTVVAVAPTGRVERLYRKRVLFDALGYRESDVLCRGDTRLALLDYMGYRIGVAVCFEIRFPEISRALALAGADAIAVPAAWYSGPGKAEQLTFLAKARAAENTVYYIVADQAGPVFAGHSLVADPYGHTVASLGADAGYFETGLRSGLVAEAREKLPLLRLRQAAVEAANGGIRLLKL